MTLNDVMRLADRAGMELSRMKVIEYVLTHTDYESNTFSGTYSEIAKEAEVNYTTVVRVMQKMQKLKVIKKAGRNRWLFTEKIAYRKDEAEPKTDEEPIWFTAPVAR